MYADFETYQKPIEEARGSKTKVTSRMNGVASYGYHIVSKVPSIPDRTVMKRKSADDFLLEMLTLGLHYRWECRNPKPLEITPEEQKAFLNATRC